MRRMFPAVLVTMTAVIVASGCGGSSDSSSTADTVTSTPATAAGTLTGSVGPGFEISMVQTTAAPGKYTLTVDDQSSSHNFHLTGPGGVDVSTEVSATGKKTFTVDLEKGTYTFVCDPHSSSMNGTLTVG